MHFPSEFDSDCHTRAGLGCSVFPFLCYVFYLSLLPHVQALPKVEGFIRHLPKTVYAGELLRLDLVLKNPSAISVKVFAVLSVSIIISQFTHACHGHKHVVYDWAIHLE